MFMLEMVRYSIKLKIKKFQQNMIKRKKNDSGLNLCHRTYIVYKQILEHCWQSFLYIVVYLPCEFHFSQF